MTSPQVIELPPSREATEKDTFNDRGNVLSFRRLLQVQHNYGLKSKIDVNSATFSLDERAEGRLNPDVMRLNAVLFEHTTDTELFIDGGGEHTLDIDPKAVVLFIKASLEEVGRRPHEVFVSAIRHNLNEAQLAALGEIGFAGFSVIPPDELAQGPQSALQPAVMHG